MVLVGVGSGTLQYQHLQIVMYPDFVHYQNMVNYLKEQNFLFKSSQHNSVRTALPKPGFAVTSDEIKKQLLQLKKVPEDCASDLEENEKQKGFTNDLTLILRNVLVQRRDAGWCDSSSNGSSGRGSQCSQNFGPGNKTIAVEWSGDDCY